MKTKQHTSSSRVEADCSGKASFKFVLPKSTDGCPTEFMDEYDWALDVECAATCSSWFVLTD